METAESRCQLFAECSHIGPPGPSSSLATIGDDQGAIGAGGSVPGWWPGTGAPPSSCPRSQSCITIASPCAEYSSALSAPSIAPKNCGSDVLPPQSARWSGHASGTTCQWRPPSPVCCSSAFAVQSPAIQPEVALEKLIPDLSHPGDGAPSVPLVMFGSGSARARSSELHRCLSDRS